jgi:hypothetical protein
MKYLIIIFLFISFSANCQVRTLSGFEPTTGRPGYKISDTIKNFYATSPLFWLNDSTIAMDTSRMSFTVAKNATRDSVIYTFFDGTRIAIKDSTGSGGSSLWNANGSDIYFNTGKVGVGVYTPQARFHVDFNGIGATAPTSDKGILLRDSTPAAAGAQQWSPSFVWESQGWNSTASASQPSQIRAYNIPIQNAGAPLGYLTFGSKYGSTAAVDNILTIGSSNGSPMAGVGINALPGNTAGAVLNIGGAMQLTGNISVTSATFGINNSGINLFNVSSGYIQLASTNAVTASNLGVQTNKPLTLGSLTAPTHGAELDIVSTGRAFLPPRMTTTQRDSINLTVTSVTVTNGGTGYTSNPTLTFTTGPVPSSVTTATATLTRTANVITSVAVTYSGHYNSTPTITVTGGGGTGAILTPVMTQVLTAGMMIYNTTTNKMQCWDGSTWNDLF